jgi:hypothetical protein
MNKNKVNLIQSKKLMRVKKKIPETTVTGILFNIRLLGKPQIISKI